MTFLEYVCRELLGPPAHGLYWCCPFHDDTSPSFHILPPDGQHKIKFKCFPCGEDGWGDEWDLIKFFHPHTKEATRIWSELHAAYEAGGGGGGVKPKSPTSRGAFPLRGRGPACPNCRCRHCNPFRPHTDKAKAMLVWDDLTPDEQAELLAAFTIADRHGIDLQPLAEMALPAAEREAKEHQRKVMEHARRCIKPYPVTNRKPRP